MSPVELRLAELRKNLKWSQSELARRSGVAQSIISRLERGETRAVDLDNLGSLADALGVNAAALIDHTKEQQGQPKAKRRK